MDNPPSDDGNWGEEEEEQQEGQGQQAGDAGAPAPMLVSDMTQTLVKNYLMLTAAMEQQNLGRFEGMLGYLECLHSGLLAVGEELQSAADVSIAQPQGPAAMQTLANGTAATIAMAIGAEQAAGEAAAAQARQQQEREEQQEQQARQQTAAAMRQLKRVQEAWWHQQEQVLEEQQQQQQQQQQQHQQLQQQLQTSSDPRPHGQAATGAAAAPMQQPWVTAPAPPNPAQRQAAAVLALGNEHPTAGHGQPQGSIGPSSTTHHGNGFSSMLPATAATGHSAVAMHQELLPGVDRPASELLVPLGLSAFVPIMEQHQVDMAALRLLNDQQLLQLGLPLGAVVKIRAGLARLDNS